MNTTTKTGTVIAAVMLIAVLVTFTVQPSDAAVTLNMEDLVSDYGVTISDDGTYTSSGITFTEGTTLDLQGKTLQFTSGGIQTTKSLTINDSVGKGKIIADSDNNSTLITVTNSAFTMNAGTLESNSTAISIERGIFTLNDGTIKAPKAIIQGAATYLNLYGGSIVSTGECAIETGVTKEVRLTGTSISVTDGIALKTTNTSNAPQVRIQYSDADVTGNGSFLSTSSTTIVNIYGGDFSGDLVSSDNDGAVNIYGGKFSSDPGTEHLADGKTYKNGYVQSASESPLITSQNGIGYDSLYQAIMGAPLDVEITLTLNGTVTENEAMTLQSGRNVTIDLNGHDLVLDAKLSINSNSVMTFDNTRNATGGVAYNSTSYISNYGTIELNDVGFELTSSYIKTSGAFHMTDGSVKGAGSTSGLISASLEVTILDGEIISEKIPAISLQEDATSLTIGGSDGDPYVSSIKVGNTDEVQFLSGTIGYAEGTFSDTSQLKGTFETDVSDTLPTGMGCVESDGGWMVVSVTADTAVAKIDSTYFASFASAIRAIEDNDTLTLLRDYEGVGATTEASVFTIDLNGHSFTSTSSVAISIDADTSSADGNIAITNSGTTESVIQASSIAIEVNTSGNGNNTLTLTVDDGVVLKTDSGERIIDLSNNTRVPATGKYLDYVTYGGFIATVDGSEYIYGGLSYALKATTAVLEGTSTKLVTLHNDLSNGISINTEGEWALDLDNHIISSSGMNIVNIGDSNIDLTILNGELVGTNTSENSTGISLAIASSGGPGQPSITYTNSSVTLDNVSMTVAGNFGIVTNGSCTEMDITLRNSTITGADCGIYFPSTGSLTVTDTDITGDSVGIEIRNGSLSISGESNITGGDEFKEPVPNGSGTTCQGVAVAVSQHTGSTAQVNVTITGGSFNGAYALYETYQQDDQARSTMSVTGGNFNAPVYSENVTKFISNPEQPTGSTGPTFSNDVSEYCADTLGAIKGDDGKYSIVTAYKVSFTVDNTVVAVTSTTGQDIVVPEIEGMEIEWDVPETPVTSDTTVTGTVTSISQPVVSIGGTPSIVDTGSTTLIGSYTGSAPSDLATVTYTWTLPDNTTKEGAEIEANIPGNYSLTVKVSCFGSEASATSSIAVVQKYTVIFMNGSTEVYRTTVDSGSTAENLDVDVPEQTGYLFFYWSTEDGTTIYQEINGPTTFYANMKKIDDGLIKTSGDPNSDETVSLSIADNEGVELSMWYYSDNEFPLDEEMILLSQPVATKTGYYWLLIIYADDSNKLGMVHIEFATAPPDPDQPDVDDPVSPPSDGDDEDLPLVIRPGTSSSGDDDTVTIVACAAAAAVAAILAVFLIMAYRKD